MAKKLLVFDFDGVLSMMYTMPEKHYPQIPELLQYLENKYLLCVASYNPRAELSIKNWKLDKYFICMRVGANHIWDHPYDESYRSTLSKAEQITNMIEMEIKTLNCAFTEIVFFDDNLENIKHVNEKLPNIKTVLIDSKFGLRLEDIPE